MKNSEDELISKKKERNLIGRQAPQKSISETCQNSTSISTHAFVQKAGGTSFINVYLKIGTCSRQMRHRPFIGRRAMMHTPLIGWIILHRPLIGWKTWQNSSVIGWMIGKASVIGCSRTVRTSGHVIHMDFLTQRLEYQFNQMSFINVSKNIFCIF